MGQKTNSNILRLQISNTNWKSKYYAKTIEESSLYIYDDLQIKCYLDRIFHLYGLITQTCKLSYSKNVLHIFLSFFTSFKFFLKYNKAFRKIKKFSSLGYNFSENILESLVWYTNKKVNIVLIFQSLNKGHSLYLTNKQLKLLLKSCFTLRQFLKVPTFKETINVFLISVKKKNSAKLLSEFLAVHIATMKKPNYFLLFLKRLLFTLLNTQLFSTRGIKILIKGRVNRARRAKTRTIIWGQVPLQKFQSNINYNCTTSFTPNGTFGVKVWVHEALKILLKHVFCN